MRRASRLLTFEGCVDDVEGIPCEVVQFGVAWAGTMMLDVAVHLVRARQSPRRPLGIGVQPAQQDVANLSQRKLGVDHGLSSSSRSSPMANTAPMAMSSDMGRVRSARHQNL